MQRCIAPAITYARVHVTSFFSNLNLYYILTVMASTMLRDAALKSPKQLYKFLLRECEKLPTDAQGFYKHSVKQSFKQHLIEPDRERVRQIMEKAVQDADWLVKKYAETEGRNLGIK